METQDLPTDLILFLREIGIVDRWQPKEKSDTITYKVWLPKDKEEEIPF